MCPAERGEKKNKVLVYKKSRNSVGKFLNVQFCSFGNPVPLNDVMFNQRFGISELLQNGFLNGHSFANHSLIAL
jgi:hypothetical protein